MFSVICEVLGAGVRDELEQVILAGGRKRNCDLTFAMEHEGHASGPPRLPWFFVKMERMSAAVRFLLSVAASTIKATPPGIAFVAISSTVCEPSSPVPFLMARSMLSLACFAPGRPELRRAAADSRTDCPRLVSLRR